MALKKVENKLNMIHDLPSVLKFKEITDKEIQWLLNGFSELNKEPTITVFAEKFDEYSGKTSKYGEIVTDKLLDKLSHFRIPGVSNENMSVS